MTSRVAREDFVAAFRAAAAKGDDVAARAALRGAFAPAVGREAALRAGLAAAEDDARIDLWIDVARETADAAREDAFANYVVGWVLQRQKLLSDADPYLARAATLAPGVGDYVDAYAWNALLRFERAEAARRASLGEFVGRQEFLTDVTRAERGFPFGVAIGGALLAALAAGAATAYVRRALRGPG